MKNLLLPISILFFLATIFVVINIDHPAFKLLFNVRNGASAFLFDSHKIDSNLSTPSETFNFARRSSCNIANSDGCHNTSKSLLLTFWSEKSKEKWVSQNILTAFPIHSFDHLIFIYDNSIWKSHPGYKDFIWIRALGQIRLWFVKRFLPPEIIVDYKYIWIVDDDSQFDFRVLDYECIISRLNIPLSAPGRLTGVMSHSITAVNQNYKNRIGRWTNFIETGPTVVASSKAWLCIYRYLDASVGYGWGIDLIWCNMLADVCFPELGPKKVCAILDAFGIHHQSNIIKSVDYGPAESVFYQNKYRKWLQRFTNYMPLSNNNSLLNSCHSTI